MISDGTKIIRVEVRKKVEILNFRDFIQKYKLNKIFTMNESELQRVHNYHIYPRDSKINSDKSFVNMDVGSQGGTHWTCFIVKGKKSFYFEPLGGQSDKFLSYQLPKPIIYHNFQIQHI